MSTQKVIKFYLTGNKQDNVNYHLTLIFSILIKYNLIRFK